MKDLFITLVSLNSVLTFAQKPHYNWPLGFGFPDTSHYIKWSILLQRPFI